MTIIRPSKRQILEYQRLLKSEWGDGFAADVIGLIKSLLHEPQSEGKLPISSILNGEFNQATTGRIIDAVLQRLIAFGEYGNLHELPALPKAYSLPKRSARHAREAVQLTVGLCLRLLAPLEGDTALLRDVQSLVFHAALHETLPALNERQSAERSILLHAMSLFAHDYFFIDPAHYCHLLSSIFGHLGRSDERLKYLSFSLGLTRVDDHSYLTKAQEYWSELVDNERLDEAETFLLSLYRSSNAEQQSEVREMIDAAFRFIASERTSA